MYCFSKLNFLNPGHVKVMMTYLQASTRTSSETLVPVTISTCVWKSRGRTWVYSRALGCAADPTESPATDTRSSARRWLGVCCIAWARLWSSAPPPWCWSPPPAPIRRSVRRRLRAALCPPAWIRSPASAGGCVGASRWD